MILSICIVTLEKRIGLLSKLKAYLNEQIKRDNLEDQVEILICSDKGERTTGEKRNELYQNALGEYVCSVDDDDWIADYYVIKIVEALKTKPDAVGLNGTMTTNGFRMETWDISLFNAYITTKKNGVPHYLRYHNHLSPLKKEIAIKFPFPHQRHGEDYVFAKAMHDANAIREEVRIPEPMYLYRYENIKR